MWGSVRLWRGRITAEKWVNNVFSVKRYDHRCLQLRFPVGTTILNVIYCQAPQPGLSTEEKDTFYERVFSVVASVPEDEMLVLHGNFNGHVHKYSTGFMEVDGMV